MNSRSTLRFTPTAAISGETQGSAEYFTKLYNAASIKELRGKRQD